MSHQAKIGFLELPDLTGPAPNDELTAASNVRGFNGRLSDLIEDPLSPIIDRDDPANL